MICGFPRPRWSSCQFLADRELPHETEVGGEPDDRGCENTHGTALYEGEALSQVAGDIAHGGHMVGGQLHNEGSRLSAKALNFFRIIPERTMEAIPIK